MIYSCKNRFLLRCGNYISFYVQMKLIDTNKTQIYLIASKCVVVFCAREKNVIPTISQAINSFPVNCYVAPWLTFRRLYDYVMTEVEEEEIFFSSNNTTVIPVYVICCCYSIDFLTNDNELLILSRLSCHSVSNSILMINVPINSLRLNVCQKVFMALDCIIKDVE